MFRGQYEHKVTSTGRVSIPSKFREICREKYDEEFFIITNFDRCLVAYPLQEWSKIENSMSALPQFNENLLASIRYLMGGASDCPVDGQGRVLIPQLLRKHANITQEVVMVGMLKKIEIWDKNIWYEEVFKGSHLQFNKNREILAEYGL